MALWFQMIGVVLGMIAIYGSCAVAGDYTISRGWRIAGVVFFISYATWIFAAVLS